MFWYPGWLGSAGIGNVWPIRTLLPTRRSTLLTAVFTALFLSAQAAFSQSPPQITAHPVDQTANTGSNVTFTVVATGTAPLRYQWRAEDRISGSFTNIPRGTNASLVLSNVSLLTARSYLVRITNTLGEVTSDVVTLDLDPGLTFRIFALRTNGYIAFEVNNIVGDDRGGMAVSSNSVFLTGDGGTGRWQKRDLTGGTNTQFYDALATDLRTERAYTLANGNTPISGGGTVTALLEINDAGTLTANRINLSASIPLSYGAGIYAGYGRIVLHDNGGNGRAYNIDLPSGRVTTLNSLFISRNGAENWAVWGVAEYSRDELYLLSGQYCCIGRTRVSDGFQTTAASFQQGLSDLASFTFSPSLSRWFFHYEGGGVFGGRDETLGSAKALFTTDPGFPEILTDPVGQTVYAGTQAVLSVVATGPELVYQWSRNGVEIEGATNATLLLSPVLPTDQGTYTVTVSNPAGTVTSALFFLSVISTPSILWGPNGGTVNANQDFHFDVGADGAPPLTFFWLFNGTNIAETTNPFLLLTNVQPAQEGYYSFIVSNVYGFVTSFETYLTVNTQAWFTLQPLGNVLYVGDPVYFYVTFDGAPPLTLQWFFNDAPLPGETNAILSRASVATSDAGIYTAVVSNPWMSVTSAPAVLTVLSVPVITDQPADEIVFPGGSASFSVQAIGPPPLSYQWYFNGAAQLDGETNTSLLLTNLTAGESGYYSVVVSNSYGSVTSAPALLTITNPLPANASFRIASLGTNNIRSVEHSPLTGDDRGGIAASIGRVFYSGDFWTAYFKLSDLSDGTRVGSQFNVIYDAMAGDLRTATAYLLADSNSLPIHCCAPIATQLLELDSNTGVTNGHQIPLSAPIPFPPFYDQNVAFFSGYGRILVYNTTNVYSIVLPTTNALATVINLGPLNIPQHQFAENWAYWGVAEYYQGTNYLVYVRDYQTIVRTRLPDGQTTILASFIDLGDMASFTVSLFHNRWYFHQQYGGQFTGLYETVSFADAVFEVNPVDHYEWSIVPSPQVISTPFTVSITARASDNSVVTNFSPVVNLSGISVPAGESISISPASSGNFVNGVWTGQVTVNEPTSAMYLNALDKFGASGASGQFAVFALNDLFVLASDTPDPVVVGQPLLYTLTVSNTGPSTATGVTLTNLLPSNIIFEEITTSSGSCTNSGGIITCDLGTVPGATGVTIIVHVTPTAVGFLTNRVTIARAESDANSTNDSVVAVTRVNLAALSVNDASIVEGNSGTNQMTFTVSLSAPATNTVTVNFLTINGTANSSDYVARNGTLTFAPGVTSQIVEIGVRGDTLWETNETFTFGLNTPVNALIARPAGIGTIINDDLAPFVLVSDATLVEGNSGTTNMAFRVRLTALTGLQILVAYATSNDTATAGSDYSPLSGVLSFAANSLTLTQTINVPIVSDTVPEYEERFYLNLTSISNALGGITQGVGTIINDDGIGVLDHFLFDPISPAQAVNLPFPVSITAKDFFNVTISNFNGNVPLSAVIPRGPPTNYVLGNIVHDNTGSGNWTLGYSFTPARDITVTHFRHYFGTKASIWTDTGTLLASETFSRIDATWVETPLTTPITLSRGVRYRVAAFTSNGNYYWPISSITSFPDGTIDEGYELGGDNFPTSSDGVRCWFVDLRYSAESPLPMTPTNSTFSGGAWSGSVTVLGAGTNVVLRARDTAGHRGESNPFEVIPADISLTITDSPDPVVGGEPLTYSILVTNTGPTAATGVILSNFLASSVTFLDATPSVGSCVNQGGIVRCDLGTMLAATTATIAIHVTPTQLGSISNRVTISRLENDAYPSNNTASALTTVTLPALSIGDASIVEGNSGTNLLSFAVTLTGRSTNTIAVNYVTFNGTASSSSDYVSTNGTLTFPPGGASSQNVQVRVRGDTLYETNETFTVGLNTVVNAIIVRNAGVGTIINDDLPPSVSITDAGLMEGNSGTTNMAFRVRLSAPTGLQILVSYSTSNGTASAGSDYLPLTNVLSFAANSLTLTQTINVPILSDTVAEYDEFFYVNLTSISNAPGTKIQGVGTITNEDGFGVLDHFAFDPVGSPQGIGLPFPLTITAKDFFGATITSFNEAVELSALIPSIRPTNYILGDVEFVNNGASCCYTLGYSFTPARDLIMTHFRHHFGTKISLWLDNGALLASNNISAPEGSWTETRLDTPLKLLRGTRYRIGAYNGSGGYYWRNDGPGNFADGIIDQSFQSFGDVFPTTVDGVRWWFADLRYTLDTPLAVAPTNSGTFTNGVWSGDIAVLAAGTNVVVRASDAAQHIGDSFPFRVVPADQADVMIALTALDQPARFISNFVFSIQVSNAGPAAATSVSVSNTVPSALEFISVLGEGASLWSNGVLNCSIASLPARSSAAFVVTTRPVQAGPLSLGAGARASQTDPILSNNTASLPISICRDCDGDGIWDDWEITNGLNPLDPSDGASDPDHDGHTTLQEFMAGTDPHSSNSVTRISQVFISGDDVRIQFRGVAGKRYRLERSDDMNGSGWSAIVTFKVGSSQMVNLIDSAAMRRGGAFYRVRLLQ